MTYTEASFDVDSVKLHMYSFMHVHIHIPQALSGSKKSCDSKFGSGASS